MQGECSTGSSTSNISSGLGGLPAGEMSEEMKLSSWRARLKKSFASVEEMVGVLQEYGNTCGVTRLLFNTPYICMLVCPEYQRTRCGAMLLGIYNQQNGTYRISRRSIHHSCDGAAADRAAEHEIVEERYAGLSLGQIAEAFAMQGIHMGHYQIFKHQMAAFSRADTENVKNTKDTCSDEALLPVYLERFAAEFRALNAGWSAQPSAGGMFIKQTQCADTLRGAVELHVEPCKAGTLMLGVVYAGDDLPVVRSLLLTALPKSEAVDAFLQLDGGSFYLVDLDMELIDSLKSAHVNFFVKAKSIGDYLETSGYAPAFCEHLLRNCESGDIEFLDLEPQYYLRKHCAVPMQGVNSIETDFSSILCNGALSAVLPDCINILVCNIAKDLRARQAQADACTADGLVDRVSHIIQARVAEIKAEDPEAFACSEGLRSASIAERIRELRDAGVLLCPCGEFQNLQIPCRHSIKEMLLAGVDPSYFVSSVYSRESLRKLVPLRPVVNMHLCMRRGAD
ncbi:hypothetical protein PAPHI01_0791 [Pancytospora philotis]|nr:hypothetical protein PAPHI01_0791 [Pancytospora philotis]